MFSVLSQMLWIWGEKIIEKSIILFREIVNTYWESFGIYIKNRIAKFTLMFLGKITKKGCFKLYLVTQVANLNAK